MGFTESDRRRITSYDRRRLRPDVRRPRSRPSRPRSDIRRVSRSSGELGVGVTQQRCGSEQQVGRWRRQCGQDRGDVPQTDAGRGGDVSWPDQSQRRTPRECSVPYTHTHPFNGPFSRTTWVGRYQKGKTNLDFTEASDSEWQWHQLGICKSAPRSRQITMPAPHHSVFTGRMPFLPPSQQRQSTVLSNYHHYRCCCC